MSPGPEGCRGWHFQTDSMPDLQAGTCGDDRERAGRLGMVLELLGKIGKGIFQCNFSLGKVKYINPGCFLLSKRMGLMLPF